MNIRLGKDQVSLLNPPNEGTIIDDQITWKIGRNSSGLITLRYNGQIHSDFIDGMDMLCFCSWINDRLK